MDEARLNFLAVKHESHMISGFVLALMQNQTLVANALFKRLSICTSDPK
jgi:hypothetical protein